MNIYDAILSWCIFIHACTPLLFFQMYVCSAVSDADGDIVRCRWANSTLRECAGVCDAFPATLDEVSYVGHPF